MIFRIIKSIKKKLKLQLKSKNIKGTFLLSQPHLYLILVFLVKIPL